MEKLCIFCKCFNWMSEDVSMGSTLTGPMFEGGDSLCTMGHYVGLDNHPTDEAEFRAVIMRGENCADYVPYK